MRRIPQNAEAVSVSGVWISREWLEKNGSADDPEHLGTIIHAAVVMAEMNEILNHKKDRA